MEISTNTTFDRQSNTIKIPLFTIDLTPPSQATVQLENSWNELKQLCINNPDTFIEQMSSYDTRILNYSKRSIVGNSINLFGVAIREKNYALVKCMLESDLFTVQTLNNKLDDRNVFDYACSTSVEIAFLMLNSNKILPSTINVHTGWAHPFKSLIIGNCPTPYFDNIRNFEIAMGSNKFLEGCNESQAIEAFHGFLVCVGSPEIIRITLNSDKLTSDIIEKIRFGSKTIIEEYCCARNREKPLKMLLDSDKVSREFVENCLSNLVIGSFGQNIQHVLITHEKCSSVREKLMLV